MMGKLTLISLLILSALLISSCKVLTTQTESSTSTTDLFYIPKFINGIPDIVELKVIERWEGTQSKDIKFNAAKAPWVINSGYSRTSELSSVFELIVGKPSETFSGIEIEQQTYKLSSGDIIGLIEDSGSFTIRIRASGVKWWVKIGVE